MRRERKEAVKELLTGAALANITDDQVAAVLRESADPNAFLKTVVGRITLDPDTLLPDPLSAAEVAIGGVAKG